MTNSDLRGRLDERMEAARAYLRDHDLQPCYAGFSPLRRSSPVETERRLTRAARLRATTAGALRRYNAVREALGREPVAERAAVRGRV